MDLTTLTSSEEVCSLYDIKKANEFAKFWQENNWVDLYKKFYESSHSQFHDNQYYIDFNCEFKLESPLISTKNRNHIIDISLNLSPIFKFAD